jgi:hypothetical protein
MKFSQVWFSVKSRVKEGNDLLLLQSKRLAHTQTWTHTHTHTHTLGRPENTEDKREWSWVEYDGGTEQN